MQISSTGYTYIRTQLTRPSERLAFVWIQRIHLQVRRPACVRAAALISEQQMSPQLTSWVTQLSNGLCGTADRFTLLRRKASPNIWRELLWLRAIHSVEQFFCVTRLTLAHLLCNQTAESAGLDSQKNHIHLMAPPMYLMAPTVAAHAKTHTVNPPIVGRIRDTIMIIIWRLFHIIQNVDWTTAALWLNRFFFSNNFTVLIPYLTKDVRDVFTRKNNKRKSSEEIYRCKRTWR